MKTLLKNPPVPAMAGLLMTLLLAYTKDISIESTRMGIWIFSTSLLFALLAFVSTKTATITSRFRILSFGSLLLGSTYFILAPLTLDWWERSDLADVVIFNIALLCFGISGCLAMYRIKSHVEKKMLLVQATIIFLMPSLAFKTYDYYLLLPESWTDTPLQPALKTMLSDSVGRELNFTSIAGSPRVLFERYE